MPDLTAGDVVTVAFEAVVEEKGQKVGIPTPGWIDLGKPPEGVVITPKPPQWRPADTVELGGVRYMRADNGTWYGADGSTKSDADVNQAFRAGRTRAVQMQEVKS